MIKNDLMLRLLATTMLCTGFAQSAMAQTPTGAESDQETRQDQASDPAITPITEEVEQELADDDGGEIVVTGSILRQTTAEQATPVTIVNADALDQRGISTIQDALQQLASNNGPALTNSFSANGAFAAGASAVSLRGLSTNSTLVLFDGLRAAFYPLADDGSRNFVDLNTIPDDIVERIEVLREGASSSYGADAIAGVVNIITRREFKGVQARVEGGVADRGDAPQYRLSLTGGVGDIEDDGFNAYLSGFYFNSELLKNSQRPYPYNSDDLRQVCFKDQCGPDNRLNGFNSAGVLGNLATSANFVVRPYDATNTTALGRNQNLSACTNGTTYTLNAADRAVNPNSPDTVCQVDLTNQYAVIQPNIERFGLSSRVTATLSDTIEGYFQANFLQSTVDYTGFPATIRGTANTGIFFRQFSTSTSAGAVAPGSFPLTLPVFVCPQGVGSANGLDTGCTAANGVLNPNNPFAAQGQVARLTGRVLDRVTYNETRNRAYRAALGVRGDLTDDISFDIGATAMHVDLRRRQEGYVYIQNLLDAVARGTFNFVNPSANSQEAFDRLMPANITNATSDQVQLQGILRGELFDLPGGAAQLAGGVSIRYEAVNSPSANSDEFGPTQRFFTLNAFGTEGSRYIYSGFAELGLPILDELELNLSGRYDDYSSGQNAFSPKVAVNFTPIRQVAFRGSYSRGFRIPSFGEANALPTTGFVTNTAAVFTDAFLQQYGCTVATFSACPTYIRTGSYGQTTLASPDLEPEKSRSFNIGAKFEPVRNVALSVDYFNIKKTGAITQPSNSPALLAYYAGQAIPAGYEVIADAPDPDFPNATPRVAFVASQLINANTIKVEGIDGALSVDFEPFNNVKFASSLEVGYILKLTTAFPDGTVERYDGTLGNFNLTAGSGTPKVHGSWQNTLDFGEFFLSGTANFFGGYDLSATDQGTGYKDCGLNPGYSPVGCRVDDYITFDLNAQFRANDQFTFYVTGLNIFDDLPPVDVVTYGAHLYNPVQGGLGILGRFFKAGVKVNF